MAKAPHLAAWLESRRRDRERLSQTLHDDVSGGLTAVGLSLDLLAMDAPPELVPRIADIQTLLETGFASVRNLSREFHPDPAIRFRLAPALHSLAARFEAKFGGQIECSIEEGVGENIAPAQVRAFYAVAEAALDNVLRHAGASRVWISFESVEGTVLNLTIRDNGGGFLTDTPTSGTGRPVMEYHVQEADMELTIQSEVGTGTRVLVTAKSIKKKKRGSHADGD